MENKNYFTELNNINVSDKTEKRNEKGQFINRHGDRKTRLYKTWCSMKERCNNPHNKSYKNYGGKGIKVCKEWNDSYEVFKKWALDSGYEDNLTIDRIDFNNEYSPNNCRWATIKEQNRNYSRNNFVIFNDKKMCLMELSEKTGINYSTILWRYKNNRNKFIEGIKEFGKIECI